MPVMGSLIALPAHTQVDEKQWQQVLKRRKWSAGLFDRDQPQKLLAAWCQTRGVEMLDLRPALQGGDNFYHADMHWNANGHRAAAAATRNFLARR